ncbi:MAG: segregation/condensation protein A [Candidatus Lambdaproteobacteria bacterium]|nr:segregation/condensation protein A [Candidatus Lambdaproteobacteria bacterium]
MAEPEHPERRESGEAPAGHPLRVSLPYFDGPLDLLLHLVRKQELDISQVRLAELTEPYLAHLGRMQALDLDVGGEFLVIAATLVWIKSRSLLPQPDAAEEEPDAASLEELLLLRLQEYQRIKDAAWQLGGRDLLGRDVFPRRPPAADVPQPPAEPKFEEVSLFALLEAFRAVLERTGKLSALHLIPERVRIEDKIDELLHRLARGQALYFHECFDGAADRGEVILVFLAMLELVRLNALRIAQAARLGEIYLTVTGDFAAQREAWRERILASLRGGTPEGPGAEAGGRP